MAGGRTRSHTSLTEGESFTIVMPSHQLLAERRTDVGKALSKMRRTNQVPAVVYGHGVPSQNLTVKAQDLIRVYREAGTTSLVDLVIDQGSPVKVLIHDLQRHPTKPSILHADFYQVKMTEKLQADIQLEMTGESPAVKELGGILVRALDTLNVECLPGDLVPSIPVDISTLRTFEDRIHVSNISVPTGITILNKADEVVASVTPPRSEAEIEALSAKVEEDVTAVGTVEKEKPAEEEVAETEAPAAPSKKESK